MQWLATFLTICRPAAVDGLDVILLMSVNLVSAVDAFIPQTLDANLREYVVVSASLADVRGRR